MQHMDAARVNLKGVLSPIGQGERDAVRQLYLAKHPGSFWASWVDEQH